MPCFQPLVVKQGSIWPWNYLKMGILDELGVELLGTKLSAIDQAEDRDLFKQLMEELNQPIPESEIVNTVRRSSCLCSDNWLPSYRSSSLYPWWYWWWMCANEEELREISENGLKLSPDHPMFD